MRSLQKLQYFVESGARRLAGAGASCPSCGSAEATVIDTKYAVTQLKRCTRCRLQFRAPTTSTSENRAFYQRAYTEGFTTTLPTDAELRAYIESGFDGEKSYTAYLEVLEALGAAKGQRLFDFGCSWGYGSWQLKKRGFDVQSFEISQPRARFAREKLGLDLVGDVEEAKAPFDIFFSAHVLEHVPSVGDAIDRALKLLRPGGLFVAFTPNGSRGYRDKDPWAWHRLWGLVHPQLLDDEFYVRRFGGRPCLLASSPYDREAIRSWNQADPRTVQLDLAGGELLCAVRA